MALYIVCAGIIVLVFRNLEKEAQFGDMFGAINALFSGLAFAAFIVALYQQQQELKDTRDVLTAQKEELRIANETNKLQADQLALQRQELRDTREEIRLQREQMELQNRTLRQQQFEATFFQMLRVFNDYKASMRWGDKPFVISVSNAASAIRGYLTQERRRNASLSMDSLINYSFSGFFNQSKGKAVFAPYFMLLYNLIKFVERTEGVNNKKTYTNIVRAQLTDDELFVLFFNGLSQYGRQHFKPLIEKYSMLKHLDTNQEIIALSRSAETKYLPGAFNEE